jgi:hypothetical protein
MTGARQNKVSRSKPHEVAHKSRPPARMPDQLGQLQQALSNQGILRRMESGLRVNDVNDPSEHEADRMAAAIGSGPGMDTQVAPATTLSVPSVVDQVLDSPGQPLDAGTRQFMESRFGQDFANVRVHTDDRAAGSAKAVAANAYTVGSHIAFDRGQFSPSSGKRLLAHELSHVVQQTAGNRAASSAPVKSGVLARDPAPVSRVTPAIERQLIANLLAERIAAPPTSNIAAEANRTFAVAAVLKRDGSVTYHSAYFDEGMAEHAEPQLLKKLQGNVDAGDAVIVAIDQVPCGADRANCQTALKAFRNEPGSGSVRVYTVRALRKDTPPGTLPSDVTREQVVSPKTAINFDSHDYEERLLFEETEFRRVRLPIYKEAPGPVTGGPNVTTPAAAVPKSVPNSAITEEEGEVPAAPGVSRLQGLGFAGVHIGLGILRGWVVASLQEDLLKAETARIEGILQARLAARRSEVADLQLANTGAKVYARIKLTTDRTSVLNYGIPNVIPPDLDPLPPEISIDPTIDLSTTFADEKTSHKGEPGYNYVSFYNTRAFSLELPLYTKAELREYVLNQLRDELAHSGRNNAGELNISVKASQLLAPSTGDSTNPSSRMRLERRRKSSARDSRKNNASRRNWRLRAHRRRLLRRRLCSPDSNHPSPSPMQQRREADPLHVLGGSQAPSDFDQAIERRGHRRGAQSRVHQGGRRAEIGKSLAGRTATLSRGVGGVDSPVTRRLPDVEYKRQPRVAGSETNRGSELVGRPAGRKECADALTPMDQILNTSTAIGGRSNRG